MKSRTRIAIAVVIGGIVAILSFGPAYVEAQHNRLTGITPPPPSAVAQTLQAQIDIVDLHADSLLWGRDLTRRSARGHVDFPRMVAGRIALQIFSIVTKVPHALNIDRNDDRSDDITKLALFERWPRATWNNLTQRALYQARRLNDFAAASHGKFVIVHNAVELGEFMQRRRFEPDAIAGIISVEGAHALSGDLAQLDVLYDAGVRMMSPSHFFDNDIGGSAHGVSKDRLSVRGRGWLEKMEQKHMVVDLAHASSRTIDDVLARARRPVIVSHTGVRGTCNNARNLSDAQLRAIAHNGGIVGIGFWDTAVCGKDADAIARAIRYTADLIGVDHVALGSDFDGSVAVPFDAAGTIALTDALLRQHFTPNEIKRIMGQNALRLLLELL